MARVLGVTGLLTVEVRLDGQEFPIRNVRDWDLLSEMVRDLLGKEAIAASAPSATPIAVPRTIVDFARLALEADGGPLPIATLVDRMRRLGWQSKARNARMTVSHQVTINSRVFCRPCRGVVALTVWQRRDS